MSRRLLSGVAAACAILALTSPAAHATRTSGPTAIVSLGDSFISGEAGRWKGNSIISTTDRAGTDRAWTGAGYDAARIYGASDATGCHRSDVAEVQSTTVSVQAKGIREVRAVMAAGGYQPIDWRFIVQSYGSPVSRAAEARYSEIDPQRST